MGYVYYYGLYFTTCTIHLRQKALQKDERKQILLDSFQFISSHFKVIIYAFVIMDNHFHIIWQMPETLELKELQRRLLSYTSKIILQQMDEDEKCKYLSPRKDRAYQIWKLNSLSVEIVNDKFLKQKMNYLHQNPEKARIVKMSEDYKYCSARSYVDGDSNFEFLTLWVLDDI